jgi:Carbon monoxide dehydrogenase subunit G (CoxG).
MVTKFELSDEGAGTKMMWSADVKIAGPVGSMGQRVLQPIVNQQVQHVLGSLETQVQDALAAGEKA